MTTADVKQVSPDVTWVGILDFDIRTFDVVMETKYGTSYNSYLVKGQKIALVETAKVKFWDEYLAKIESICNPEDIAYIVMDHTEPDHAGSLEKLLELAPNAVVVGSSTAIKFLGDIVNKEFKYLAVKDGDTLDLGTKTLHFISAPNLHWPDSIYTYLAEDKILFTCDSFGAHFCHKDVFDDLVGDYQEAFDDYYTAILRPFSRFFLQAIEKIRPLEISVICPGPGPVLRKNWKKYVDLSEKYSAQYIKLPENNLVMVAYVSAYGYTAALAEKIAEGVRAGGLEANLLDIEKMSAGEMANHLERANAFIFGSSTVNQNALPPIYTCLSMVCPLRDKGKMAGSFGSYGWSGEAKQVLEANISALKLNFVGSSYFVKFKPSDKELKGAYEYGLNFGQRML